MRNQNLCNEHQGEQQNQNKMDIQANKQQLKSLGIVKVNKNCPDDICKQIQAIVHKNYNKDTKNMHLSSQNWQKNNLPQISKFIIEWNCPNILQFYANNYSFLYKEIQNIKFPSLKYLNTWGNNIESIQMICRIQFPNLQQICLWNNRITKISPFRRISAPKLNWIDLKQNYIQDHNTLFQYHNVSKTIRRLHLSQSYSFNFVVVKIEANIFNDVSFMFKQKLINKKIYNTIKTIYLDAQNSQQDL